MYQRWLCFDTETELIPPARWAPLPQFVVAGFLDEEGNYTMTKSVGEAAWKVEQALAKDIPVIGHNLAYDLAIVGVVPRVDAKLHDTMFADLLLRLRENDAEEKHPGPCRLRKLSECLGGPMEGKGTTQLSFRAGVPLSIEQKAYLQADVRGTARLAVKQVGRVVPGGLDEMTLQVRAAMALDRLSKQGLQIDLQEIEHQRALQFKRKHEAALELQAAGLYVPEKKGPRGGRKKAHLIPRKAQVLLKYLCRREGEKPPLTEKGAVQIDRDAFSPFQLHPHVAAWLKYKDSEKILNTFLDKWKDSVNGSIHPRYNVMVRTGRTSCSDPNLQQVPSRGAERKQVKKVFVAGEGRVFFELDYAQLELCALAYLTQGTLKEAINKGIDVHRWLGSVYFQKEPEEVTKEERQLMKCANFGLPGGMGSKKFRKFIRSQGLPDPGEENARRLINSWMGAFPEMADWLRDDCTIPRAWRMVWAGRDLDRWNITAREAEIAWSEARLRAPRLPMPLYRQLNAEEGSPALERWITHRRVVINGGRVRSPVTYTEQRNARFQGLAANLAKRALSSVVLEHSKSVQVHTFIHDSLLISVEEFNQNQVPLVATRMLDAARFWLPGIRIGVEACGPGKSWFEAKEGAAQKFFVEGY